MNLPTATLVSQAKLFLLCGGGKSRPAQKKNWSGLQDYLYASIVESIVYILPMDWKLIGTTGCILVSCPLLIIISMATGDRESSSWNNFLDQCNSYFLTYLPGMKGWICLGVAHTLIIKYTFEIRLSIICTTEVKTDKKIWKA